MTAKTVKTRAEMTAILEKTGIPPISIGDEVGYLVGDPYKGTALKIGTDFRNYRIIFNARPVGGYDLTPYWNPADYFTAMNQALEMTLACIENEKRIEEAAKARPAKDDRTLIQEALLNSFYVHSDQERYLVGSPEPEDQSIFMTIRHDLMHFDVSLGGLTVAAAAAPADHLEAYYARLLKYLRITLRITDACMLQENYLENGE